ncbi:DUF2357 domain-containing protein [Pseudomonas sp. S31]|uniref:nuclease domain-containing protein n=1 Tax=Pseudomonas sp. S31 TaxID=1564473 RepID=UPI0019149A8A|nr:nuclease domain-containing protein [Pseudomonas sp. S31]MBK5000015.1 DUF2357 domain-containing protein [Pseudomonas sp. S31]
MIEILLLIQDHEGIKSYSLQENFTEIPAIRETDAVSFRAISPSNFGEPKIFIQDHCIALNRPTPTGDFTEHTVEFGRYLANHFGVTSLAVGFTNSDELIRITPVEVYATKINKEQAEKILIYLSSKMSDVTHLCFTKTHMGSDQRPGNPTDTLTKIDFSRKALELLISNRHRFATQPCKRSVEFLHVSNYENSTHITDRDIAWLFQHLDQIYPAPYDDAKVTINNRHYSIDQIQRTNLKSDTNLFENQVIYSFLINMKIFLTSVPDFRKKYNLHTPYKDYYTFDSILQKVEAPLMERRYREARSLLQQCNELIAFFDKHIPCTIRSTVAPILTPQAKRFTHYERAFRTIDSWYKLGQPTWSGSNYLFGLKSLDKLYEFFCLYKIADKLNDLGYELTSSSSLEPDRAFGLKGRPTAQPQDRITNYYKFESDEKTLELFYEPTIWGYSEASKAGELVDVHHSKSASKPYFTPDFVIRQDCGDDFPTYYIFDSKYSTESQTRDRHLPSIIEKYYLKLKAISKNHQVDSRAIKMVYALIPKTYTQEQGYHGGPFNLYDKLPASPFFGFLKLTPDEERPLDKLLTTLFKRTSSDLEAQHFNLRAAALGLKPIETRPLSVIA